MTKEQENSLVTSVRQFIVESGVLSEWSDQELEDQIEAAVEQKLQGQY